MKRVIVTITDHQLDVLKRGAKKHRTCELSQWGWRDALRACICEGVDILEEQLQELEDMEVRSIIKP